MTTSKFTPGPWTVAANMRGLGNVPVAGVETPAGLALANCGAHGEANARLIASAPDLLEALQAIVEASKCTVAGQDYYPPQALSTGPALMSAICAARAAIARATGAA